MQDSALFREAEQRSGEVADRDRRADLFGVEGHVVAPGERLLRAVGRAVQERRAHDQRFRVKPPDELLGLELLLAVLHDRPRLVVLGVGRPVLAVEDEVGRKVDQPCACAVCGERDVMASADDRVGVAHDVRGVNDDVGTVLEETAHRRVDVAHVELYTLRYGGAVPRCERVGRLPAELAPEVAGAARDQYLHSRILATWVALLRAVNLGSRNKVPMAGLRAAMSNAGYDDVRTVIASGNVVFSRSAKPSARALESLIADEFDVRTTVILRSGAQLKKLRAARPFDGTAYVAFLTMRPRTTRPIEGLDDFAVVGSDIVLHFPRGYAAAQLTGAVLEKRLGVEATVRNWNTVEKLADLV